VGVAGRKSTLADIDRINLKQLANISGMSWKQMLVGSMFS
jgi:hypothetical protein